MLIGFIGATGLTLKATVKRLADGYYFRADTLVFAAAPTFVQKGITLTEGVSEEAYYYSATVTSTSWNDGLYEVKIHNDGASDEVMAGEVIAMMDGLETTPGNEVAIYHADVNFVKDATNSSDEYMVSWFKNGARINSGLSAVTITVTDKSNTTLISAASMTNVTGGLYRYTALTTERQTDGEIYRVTIGATYSGSSLSYSWNLGRDD
jgi:hypothetical protein